MAKNDGNQVSLLPTIPTVNKLANPLPQLSLSGYLRFGVKIAHRQLVGGPDDLRNFRRSTPLASMGEKYVVKG